MKAQKKMKMHFSWFVVKILIPALQSQVNENKKISESAMFYIHVNLNLYECKRFQLEKPFLFLPGVVLCQHVLHEMDGV